MRKIILTAIMLLCLCSVVYAAPDFLKTPYEDFYLYHEFYRTDGQGWLSSGETISTATVYCYELKTGTEKTSTMIANTSIITGNAASSRVKYEIKGGTALTSYLVKVKITTSAGQKFEDWAEVWVK